MNDQRTNSKQVNRGQESGILISVCGFGRLCRVGSLSFIPVLITSHEEVLMTCVDGNRQRKLMEVGSQQDDPTTHSYSQTVL